MTKDIIFVLQLLKSLGIKVNLPITVRVDNIGAIIVSKNNNTTSGTKHIDVRTKYVSQYCEDGVIKIIFVESANNDADIFTRIWVMIFTINTQTSLSPLKIKLFETQVQYWAHLGEPPTHHSKEHCDARC